MLLKRAFGSFPWWNFTRKVICFSASKKNLSSRASMSFSNQLHCFCPVTGLFRTETEVYIHSSHFLAQEIKSVLFLTANNLKLIQRQHIAKCFSFRTSILLDRLFLHHEEISSDSCASLILLVFSILCTLSFVNSQILILLFSYSVDLFCF